MLRGRWRRPETSRRCERLDDDGVARFGISCPLEHEGGPGVAHGGWTVGGSTRCSVTCPSCTTACQVTVTLHGRFEKPVPIERPLEARAWVARREPRKWSIAGELVLASSEAVLARADGIFVLREPGDPLRANFKRWLAEQEVTSERWPAC